MELKKTKISIIVPVYNVEKYIRKCINSLVAQTYSDIEIILVNDGSSDNSGLISEEYALLDNRIKVFHIKNSGVSAARNLGVRKATGNYIGFVDADDWIDPDMYEVLIEGILKYNTDIAICGFSEISNNIKEFSGLADTKLLSSNEALKLNLINDRNYQICTAPWNKLYKSSLVKKIEFPIGKIYEDIIFTTKVLSLADKCVYLGNSKYNYLVERTGSTMNLGFNIKNISDEIPLLLERISIYKENNYDDLQNIAVNKLADKLIYYYSLTQKSTEFNNSRIKNEIINYTNIFLLKENKKNLNKTQKIKITIFRRFPNLLGNLYRMKIGINKKKKKTVKKLT